ncbi:UNKNOWN [Stylonychia lemnae]|uniref:Lebercilin domain-containing protein n=1 Tax=Stylonychia lemnae TaxID=5949 RepID=A0A078A890_STYLE|nr:UNKNOWN [Stylonychia lemnae]|eukprot:CDW76996.1 UNKNOWN [Stylonychia lemnae]
MNFDDPSQFLMMPPGGGQPRAGKISHSASFTNYYDYLGNQMKNQSSMNMGKGYGAQNSPSSQLNGNIKMPFPSQLDVFSKDGNDQFGYKDPENFNDFEGMGYNGAPSIVDTYIGDSQKDQLIQKLRQQNGILREKLKELNVALDTALEKASKNLNKKNNQLPPNIEQLFKSKDREMMNQEQQILNLKKEVQSLRQRLDTDSGIEKQMKLESNLKEAEKRNQELMREIKALQKIQNEQGKALDKITNSNDYINKIKNLMDELKLTKERLKDFEEKARGQIQLKNFDKDEQKSKDQLIEELQIRNAQLEKNKEILEKSREQDLKKIDMMRKKHKSQIEELFAQLEHLNRGYKEKDQESRIVASRLKEMSRGIKNSQLAPLNDRIRNASVDISLNQDIQDKAGARGLGLAEKSSIVNSHKYQSKIPQLKQVGLKHNFPITQPQTPSKIRNLGSQLGSKHGGSSSTNRKETEQFVNLQKVNYKQMVDDTKKGLAKNYSKHELSSITKNDKSDEEFYDYDEKSFEKRYGQRLNQASTIDSENQKQSQFKNQKAGGQNEGGKFELPNDTESNVDVNQSMIGLSNQNRRQQQ